MKEIYKIRDVKPHHETIERGGVRFAVEDVKLGDAPKRNYIDFTRPNYHREHTLPLELNDHISSLYNKEQSYSYKPNYLTSNIHSEGELYEGGGLFQAIHCAWKHHYPISFRPDDIWLLITYAMVKHIENNSKELRSNFVNFEDGKQELKIIFDRLLYDPSDPDTWENVILPSFCEEIKKNTKNDIHKLFTQPFSTTTKLEQTVHETFLMSGMNAYFDYTGFMMSGSGIPFVELYGIKEDWVNLRKRAKELGELMTTEFKDLWMPMLIPILDEFINAFNGQVNHLFWQSMYKRVQYGEASGGYSTVSGWINILYPYLGDKNSYVNEYMNTWDELVQRKGPEPDDFPNIIESAPIKLVDIKTNEITNVHIHAGQFIYSQDESSLVLRSEMGWAVTIDPANYKKPIKEEMFRISIDAKDCF